MKTQFIPKCFITETWIIRETSIESGRQTLHSRFWFSVFSINDMHVIYKQEYIAYTLLLKVD